MQRIDTFLVEHDLAESREQAKRLILAGAVSVNGNTRIKPGQRIPMDAEVVVQERQKYVSRGGFKLEKALMTFDVDVRNRVALDVGASTGGFTDCLLQHGAKFVYAVDVGYGQLAWKLRTHPQVQSIEKTNIRHLTPTLLSRGEVTFKESAEIPQAKTPSSKNTLHNSENFISIAVIDVSFISLRTALPSVIKILTQQNSYQSSVRFFCEKPFSCQLRGGLTESESSLTDNLDQALDSDTFTKGTSSWSKPITDNYDIIALLKPQFEAGKAHVKKGGVVSDRQVHIETIDNLISFVTEKLGATVHGLTYSPIHKDIRNIEYLLWLTINPDQSGNRLEAVGARLPRLYQTTAEVVADAHETFGNGSQQRTR